MKKNLSISLIIPTYNDGKTIVSQITRCEKILKSYCNHYEIIIADDFSTDNTRTYLLTNFKTNKHITLLFNKKNLGITKNILQLYKLARLEYILFYSADGDWETRDVKRLIKTYITTNADIVIGKREKKIGYTWYRHTVSFFHKFIPFVVFGVDTIDPGGIKIVQRKLAHIHLVSKSQFFEAEIIIRAKLKGYTITSCPVVYKKVYHGSGYGGNIKDAYHSLLDVLRLKLYILSHR